MPMKFVSAYFVTPLEKMIGLCYTIVSYLEGECCLMPLSILLKTMRKKALLSQEEFATALAVSVGTINRWENGKTKPNITAMKKLKNFCTENAIPFEDIETAWLADKE